jgi:hypothetical protein
MDVCRVIYVSHVYHPSLAPGRHPGGQFARPQGAADSVHAVQSDGWRSDLTPEVLRRGTEGNDRQDNGTSLANRRLLLGGVLKSVCEWIDLTS